jgi:ribulose-5-phosphate 4-epimerase/fuculose-1-phosphate aldolase
LVQLLQMKSQFIDGCRRLARKGFLNSPTDSFSMRIPGQAGIMLASGLEDWARIGAADFRTVSHLSAEGLSGFHATIYQARGDVGAVAISSPKGSRLLARHGGILPPLFDEQVRHIGRSERALPGQVNLDKALLRRTLRRGANAVLLGEQLLCLGMTCERVLFNTELYEKCAQAYVIARESGGGIGCIPVWVRFIATRRLLRNECDAAASYGDGLMPEGISGY